jgi:GAF domain-containing protein
MSTIQILAAIRPDAADRYQTYFAEQDQYATQVVTAKSDLISTLDDADSRADVLVIDNELGGVFELVRELRQRYPRLLIILVDEDADFSMPGRADDVSTDPFHQDDLLKRIQRLLQERQTETLRADALPPIRTVAKKLREASGVLGKTEAAVKAIADLDYDFVAYYRLESEDSPLILSATAGPQTITSIAPDQQKETTLVGWVAQNGQSRIVAPDDDPNYGLVKRGRLGAGACVPVGGSNRFGVLLAGRERPDSISQENVMMLELISTQLASALANEMKM